MVTAPIALLGAVPDVGDPPGPGASADEWNAYFDALAARSDASRKAHDADVKAQAQAQYVDWAKSVPFLGDMLGPIAKQFFAWSYDLGARIGKWFYRKPDWNDPKWVTAAMGSLARLAEHGWQGTGPIVGADAASTDNAIDWAERLREAERGFALFAERYPEADATIARAMSWALENPDNPGIQDLRAAGLFPLRASPGTTMIPSMVVGLARLLALYGGRDQKAATASASVASYRATHSSELAPNGEPYKYSGNPYTLGEELAAIVHAVETSPEAATFLVAPSVTGPDYGGGPLSLFGADAPTGGTGGASSSSGAGSASGPGAGAFLLLVGAYVAIQFLSAKKAR